MPRRSIELETVPGDYSVARLDPSDPWPEWAQGALVSTTRTRDELSVICETSCIPTNVGVVEGGFTALRVVGPVPFDQVGVLADLAAPLAEAGVSLFAVSTFDTDYLLLKSAELEKALECLGDAGHRLR